MINKIEVIRSLKTRWHRCLAYQQENPKCIQELALLICSCNLLNEDHTSWNLVRFSQLFSQPLAGTMKPNSEDQIVWTSSTIGVRPVKIYFYTGKVEKWSEGKQRRK